LNDEGCETVTLLALIAKNAMRFPQPSRQSINARREFGFAPFSEANVGEVIPRRVGTPRETADRNALSLL
jgi:hypothetical protein